MIARLAFLPLFICSGSFLLSEPAVSAEKVPPWRWEEDDLKKISELEGVVVRGQVSFRLENDFWRVKTMVSPRFTAELLLYMTLLRKRFQDALGLDGVEAQAFKPRIVVVANKAEYVKLYSDGSRGHYSFRFTWRGRLTNLTMYSYVESEEERDFRNFYRPILHHEGAHLLLRLYFGRRRVPIWLDEGLAMYFQYWDLNKNYEENVAGRHRNSHFIARLGKRSVRFAGKGDRLDYLLGLHARTWNPDRMGPLAEYHYGLAESLIDFLFTTPTSKRILIAIIKMAIHGERELFTEEQRGKLRFLWTRHLLKIW